MHSQIVKDNKHALHYVGRRKEGSMRHCPSFTVFLIGFSLSDGSVSSPLPRASPTLAPRHLCPHRSSLPPSASYQVTPCPLPRAQLGSSFPAREARFAARRRRPYGVDLPARREAGAASRRRRPGVELPARRLEAAGSPAPCPGSRASLRGDRGPRLAGGGAAATGVEPLGIFPAASSLTTPSSTPFIVLFFVRFGASLRV
jgi:hypothetical protein